MWWFARATSRPSVFTLRGTLNVLFAGAIAGVVGSVLLIALRRVLPARSAWRGALFALLCYLVAMPGFRPPLPLVFGLFAPAFLGYGLALVFLDAHVQKAAG
jgi:hypothetical protein